MKRKPFLLGSVAAAVLFGLSACSEDQPGASDSANLEASESQESAAYPLDVCVVSGKKLGSMGQPYVITHEGTEVRFCCDGCLPRFNADPAKYVAMVKAPEPDPGDQAKPQP